MAKKLSREKAKEIMRDGTVHGKPLDPAAAGVLRGARWWGASQAR